MAESLCCPPEIITMLLICYATAAAKLLQSCLTLCDPIEWQPTRLPCPWDGPGKNTGVGCHFLLQCVKEKVKVKSLSRARLSSNPMDCSLPGSSVHGSLQAGVLEWGVIACTMDNKVWYLIVTV